MLYYTITNKIIELSSNITIILYNNDIFYYMEDDTGAAFAKQRIAEGAATIARLLAEGNQGGPLV